MVGPSSGALVSRVVVAGILSSCVFVFASFSWHDCGCVCSCVDCLVYCIWIVFEIVVMLDFVTSLIDRWVCMRMVGLFCIAVWGVVR